MNATVRRGGVAGILAGAAYIVQALMGRVRPQTEVFSGTSDYVLEAVFVAALVATGLALVLGLPLSVFLAGFAGGGLLGLAWLATGIYLLRK